MKKIIKNQFLIDTICTISMVIGMIVIPSVIIWGAIQLFSGKSAEDFKREAIVRDSIYKKIESETKYVKVKNHDIDFKVYVIDSCEYIGSIYGNRQGFSSGLLTHKGNCKFCKERNKKLIGNN